MSLLTLTLLFIIISTLITTFINKTKKDRCLKDFINDNITIEIGGSIEKGVMKLESTGMELYYKEKKDTERGNKESSYILYRGDLERIDLFIRFLDDLSKENKEDREKELKNFYHPSIIRTGWRKTVTFMKMIKDSVI